MTKKQINYNPLFNSLAEVAGIEGIIVVNYKYQIQTEKWQGIAFSTDKILALVQELLDAVSSFCKQTQLKGFNEILQEGDFGKIYILDSSNLKLIFILYGVKLMNVGMVRVILEKFLKSQ